MTMKKVDTDSTWVHEGIKTQGIYIYTYVYVYIYMYIYIYV